MEEVVTELGEVLDIPDKAQNLMQSWESFQVIVSPSCRVSLLLLLIQIDRTLSRLWLEVLQVQPDPALQSHTPCNRAKPPLAVAASAATTSGRECNERQVQFLACRATQQRTLVCHRPRSKVGAIHDQQHGLAAALVLLRLRPSLAGLLPLEPARLHLHERIHWVVPKMVPSQALWTFRHCPRVRQQQRKARKCESSSTDRHHPRTVQDGDPTLVLAPTLP